MIWAIAIIAIIFVVVGFGLYLVLDELEQRGSL
jgi:hypothetical protein